MAIVDYGYYSATYMGEAIAGDFPRACARAERLINQITYGRAEHYDALPPALQDAVKKAICAQIEYYALMGIDISVTGETASDWTVGKVSVRSDGSRSGNVAAGASSMVCPAAIAILEQTGLLDPSCPAVGYLPPFWGVIP